MLHQTLTDLNAKFAIRVRYDNFIGGKWVAPVRGQYFDNPTPITGAKLCEVARSTAEDIELALDAAHAAARPGAGPLDRRSARRSSTSSPTGWRSGWICWPWSRPSTTASSIRETTAADLPLAVDHFRYFAACVRAQEGSPQPRSTTTPSPTISTSPWAWSARSSPGTSPLLMAVWKLAPALAAGNCVVLKPAEQTPMSIMTLMDLVGDLLPPGVLNVVNGFGVEAGKPLAQNKRIAKVAFTGETSTGRLIMQYAAENIIPVTLELGGKSPNIFFADVMAEDDDYLDKALEGFAMFALNQGEVCTCRAGCWCSARSTTASWRRRWHGWARSSRADPLDPATMIGASGQQRPAEKILGLLHRSRPAGGGRGPYRRCSC
ncbi:MAG: aldehyde dehydrogenase family protein [Geminicoccaceae bacterium]